MADNGHSNLSDAQKRAMIHKALLNQAHDYWLLASDKNKDYNDKLRAESELYTELAKEYTDA